MDYRDKSERGGQDWAAGDDEADYAEVARPVVRFRECCEDLGYQQGRLCKGSEGEVAGEPARMTANRTAWVFILTFFRAADGLPGRGGWPNARQDAVSAKKWSDSPRPNMYRTPLLKTRLCSLVSQERRRHRPPNLNSDAASSEKATLAAKKR